MIWLFFPLFAFAGPCPSVAPHILHREKAGQTVYWEIAKTPAWFARATGAEQENYEHWVESHTSLGTRELIENNMRVGQKLKSALASGDSFRRSIEKNERNSERVLSGQAGSFHSLSCLEALPLRKLERLFKHEPREFYASLLENNGRLLLVADFYRKGYTGAGESAFARSLVRKRTRSGWKWQVNFHNHPFDFQNSYGDLGGVLVPSEADIANYQTSRPPEAWITNGLNTVVFQPGAYQRLEP